MYGMVWYGMKWNGMECNVMYVCMYVAVKIVEDHCSIAEALLSEMCKGIGPLKAIVAQNTGKRYGPPKRDSR